MSLAGYDTTDDDFIESVGIDTVYLSSVDRVLMSEFFGGVFFEERCEWTVERYPGERDFHMSEGLMTSTI